MVRGVEPAVIRSGDAFLAPVRRRRRAEAVETTRAALDSWEIRVLALVCENGGEGCSSATLAVDLVGPRGVNGYLLVEMRSAKWFLAGPPSASARRSRAFSESAVRVWAARRALSFPTGNQPRIVASAMPVSLLTADAP